MAVWNGAWLYGMGHGCMEWSMAVWNETWLYGMGHGCME